jgi:hypothetical protein
MKKRKPHCIINLSNGKNIQFTRQVKYLGSFVSLELHEDTEIAYRIKKAEPLMGMLHYCYDIRGHETWNLAVNNL